MSGNVSTIALLGRIRTGLSGFGVRDPDWIERKKSILDAVNDNASSLEQSLGADDRRRLDQYLSSIRDIERSISSLPPEYTAVAEPENDGDMRDWPRIAKTQSDLLAHAFASGQTRVASYIMVAEGTNRTYNHIGVSDSFHPVSHHANEIGRLEKLVKIQTWHVERFAAFVKKLAAVKDGDGTLLDHAMFLYGSNMSNSDKHNGHPLPTVLVGGGNGKLRGSQHIDPGQPTPLANVHLTILDKINARQEKFGDSTGLIANM